MMVILLILLWFLACLGSVHHCTFDPSCHDYLLAGVDPLVLR